MPGATIFFTVALAHPVQYALTDHIALLRAAVNATRKERPFTVECWVVLPDQQSCIWTLPQGDCDYPTRWRLIKSRFSRALPAAPLRWSHIRRSERGIWQRRYWEHHIRNRQDLADHLQYCRLGPVRHGLVRDPKEWPHAYVHPHHAQLV